MNASEKMKVLIAEDNLVLGDVLLFNLQRAGFSVTLARSGVEARRLVTSSPFDVLVTDYEMPGLNGEELCNYIRNKLMLNDIQIVMCSAKGLELNCYELKSKLNISAILYKPFSIRELTSLLEKLEAKTHREFSPNLVQ